MWSVSLLGSFVGSKGSTHMKIVPLAILAIGTLISAGALLFTQNGAYCLQGSKWGYPGSCKFSTFQQCTAAARGKDAECGTNPRMQ
jgi:hypothetical protein